MRTPKEDPQFMETAMLACQETTKLPPSTARSDHARHMFLPVSVTAKKLHATPARFQQNLFKNTAEQYLSFSEPQDRQHCEQPP